MVYVLYSHVPILMSIMVKLGAYGELLTICQDARLLRVCLMGNCGVVGRINQKSVTLNTDMNEIRDSFISRLRVGRSASLSTSMGNINAHATVNEIIKLLYIGMDHMSLYLTNKVSLIDKISQIDRISYIDMGESGHLYNKVSTAGVIRSCCNKVSLTYLARNGSSYFG